MNENLNLEKILKYYPKGTKLYSPALGEVDFVAINYYDRTYPIVVKTKDGTFGFTKQGKLYDIKQSECLLFPSKEKRDWFKFTTPWGNFEKRCGDKKEIKNFDVLPGLYKCIHSMFDGTSDDRLLFERGNIYKCLSKHDRAEFEVSYGHSVYLEDPIVCRYFIPFIRKGEQTSSQTHIKKNKDKFDPKTLKPFDKVLVRRGSENYDVWFPDFVSYPPDDTSNKTLCMCIQEDMTMVIPYNDDTKHLVGTSNEAPEFYRYWED